MKKFIKPRDGLIVRHRKTFSILPPEGELVDWGGRAGSYWRRRVKCGDVSIVKQEKAEPQTTSPKIKRKENK